MYGDSIVVTGSRIRRPNLESAVPITSIGGEQFFMAGQENLGDLKLYRIPEAVTFAANSQKQIALLSKSKVPFERITSAWLLAGRRTHGPEEAGFLLRTRNIEKRKLGLPLPMGPLAIFENVGGRLMLTGQGAIAESAVGQEVEISVGVSPGVHVQQRFAPAGKSGGRKSEDEDDDFIAGRYVLEVSNATSRAAQVEINLRRRDQAALILRPSRPLSMKNGRYVWRTKVPANGRSTLSYVYVPEPDDEDED